jgi:hypothetical protein
LRPLSKHHFLKRLLTILLIGFVSQQASAQTKVETIEFNLYTDSLKKGFFNYINVDGKLSNGTWTPLDSSQIRFTSNAGFFKGNDLFIDSSVKDNKIIVRAVLKSNPAIYKEITIYIRKRGFDEPLKTNDELIQEMNEQSRKRKKDREA